MDTNQHELPGPPEGKIEIRHRMSVARMFAVVIPLIVFISLLILFSKSENALDTIEIVVVNTRLGPNGSKGTDTFIDMLDGQGVWVSPRDGVTSKMSIEQWCNQIGSGPDSGNCVIIANGDLEGARTLANELRKRLIERKTRPPYGNKIMIRDD